MRLIVLIAAAALVSCAPREQAGAAAQSLNAPACPAMTLPAPPHPLTTGEWVCKTTRDPRTGVCEPHCAWVDG
jgi:hypothetical protein